MSFKRFLGLHGGFFILGVLKGLISGSILTLILGALIWLTRGWTGFEPDWLPLWLGTVTVATLFYRPWTHAKGHTMEVDEDGKITYSKFTVGGRTVEIKQNEGAFYDVFIDGEPAWRDCLSVRQATNTAHRLVVVMNKCAKAVKKSRPR
jgi:hypothetical protein